MAHNGPRLAAVADFRDPSAWLKIGSPIEKQMLTARCQPLWQQTGCYAHHLIVSPEACLPKLRRNTKGWLVSATCLALSTRNHQTKTERKIYESQVAHNEQVLLQFGHLKLVAPGLLLIAELLLIFFQ